MRPWAVALLVALAWLIAIPLAAYICLGHGHVPVAVIDPAHKGKWLSVEMRGMYAYGYKQMNWTIHSGLQGPNSPPATTSVSINPSKTQEKFSRATPKATEPEGT